MEGQKGRCKEEEKEELCEVESEGKKTHTHACVSLAASRGVFSGGGEGGVNDANSSREANGLDGGSSHDELTRSDVGEMTTHDNRS